MKERRLFSDYSLQSLNDLAIRQFLAWGIDRPEVSPVSILAASPADFKGSKSVVSDWGGKISCVVKPSQITNAGITYTYRISLGDLKSRLFNSFGAELSTTRIRLPCRIDSESEESMGAILSLQNTSGIQGTRMGVRKVRRGAEARFPLSIDLHHVTMYIPYDMTYQDAGPDPSAYVWRLNDAMESYLSVRVVFAYCTVIAIYLAQLISLPYKLDAMLIVGMVTVA